MNVDGRPVGNRLLAALEPEALDLVRPHLQRVELSPGRVLFEPGDEVEKTYFPGQGTIVSLTVVTVDGGNVEAATVGCEGAIGGIVSAGRKPAFGRAVVKNGGSLLKIGTSKLELAKQASPAVGDLMARYADCLVAQLMQVSACNALHSLEQRCCRWLLSAHDRAGVSSLTVTQEELAEALGAQRTSITAVAKYLQKRGVFRTVRGRIDIIDRSGLERVACGCYRAVELHREQLLPKVQR